MRKIKQLWSEIDSNIKDWNEVNHNPIEEIEYKKNIAKKVLEVISYQLQTESILDFSKVFKYCEMEYLENAVKEVLFNGAKNEVYDEMRRNKLLNSARNLAEKDLYDYKLWLEVLEVKNIRVKNEHIEIIGTFQNKDKSRIIDTKFENMFSYDEKQNLDMVYDESLSKKVKLWLAKIFESARQRKMGIMWKTLKGPGFKVELLNGNVVYSNDFLEKTVVENTKKLIVAGNGVAKYNFDNGAKWKCLEEIDFLDDRNIACVNLSPDKTYSCIGKDSFEDASMLKNVVFGNIEMIGERAFKNCNNLSSVVFPKSLKNIGEDAFCDCDNLTNVTFLGNLQLYILQRPQNVLRCFKGTKLKKISFPDMESVFNFAITDCPFLMGVCVSSISDIEIPFKVCKYRFRKTRGNCVFCWSKFP